MRVVGFIVLGLLMLVELDASCAIRGLDKLGLRFVGFNELGIATIKVDGTLSND